MRLYIAFDDTDNLESPGTGHLLEDFRGLVGKRNWGPAERITRHQLFFHPDVPYTSHNSAMCFVIETETDRIEEIEAEAAGFLRNRSAPGSDPGLCLLSEDALKERQRLIIYGGRAKSEILDKDRAYKTAAVCGARLSEHGGTGDGIIGALAGVALRLGGSDGRYRGQLEGLSEGCSYSAEELLNHPGIERLALLSPEEEPEEISYPEKITGRVFLCDKPKTINLKGRSVFLFKSPQDAQVRDHLSEISYMNWTRAELKRF